MRYEAAKNLEPEEFKRLCGVSLTTFEQMVKVVAAEKVLAKKRMRARRVSRRFSGSQPGGFLSCRTQPGGNLPVDAPLPDYARQDSAPSRAADQAS